MAKFMLLSILIATVAIPMWLAKNKSPRSGLRRVLIAMGIYVFLWTGFCVYFFLRMGGGY
jgi:hypothetical protein